MDTIRLIETLAGDRRQWPPDPTLALRRAAVLATAIAAAIILLTFSIRLDLAIVAKTPEFAWRLASTASLGVSAFCLVLRLSRPGNDWRPAAANLTVAPTLLAMGIVVADFLPRSAMLSAVSTNPNGFVCLAGIVLAGLAPLGIVVAALRQGAPTHPATAGAAAGLLAGGIAATFFAAHCASDSLLFVATWYTFASAILAALGATVAHRLIRW
ncbi:NrsF family protein [Mesorhizobium tianshanense]|uniref:DUF1109 family protein n=1 Tax=Mesorhizobium tianshanense TaxID=39844 RepID=A0A562P2N7_9HYPH|nr:NrsF family protein [Mesorhizobium tianshanense]TWI38714.1 hypothetical protein IQ26_02135 [Mesorhizobium tianshanense]